MRSARAPRAPGRSRMATSTHGSERRLARYSGTSCGPREVVEYEGARGTRLVVDQAIDNPVAGSADRRLVAHLAADEPRANADLASRLYLESDPPAGTRR